MKLSERFPRKCECGGKMHYMASFGQVFSYCETCTPTVTVNVAKLDKQMQRAELKRAARRRRP